MSQAYAGKIVTKGTRMPSSEHNSVGSTETSRVLETVESEPPLPSDEASHPPKPAFEAYPHDRFLAAVNREMSAKDYARDVLRHAGVRFDARGRHL